MSQRLCGDHWISLHRNEQNILYVQMGDSIMNVPVTPNGDVLFITEPSSAYDERVLFLPSGNIEAGESPAFAANRELQEEIGYRADQLDHLGDLHPFIKYVRCRMQIYLARHLEPSKLEGDEGPDWRIDVEPHPLSSFEDLIASGRLSDSTVIAALYMARNALQTAATA
jgi:ADP-ribose diphosphatase